MRILVTGATGFIGRRLVRTLFTLGHELVVLGRSRARAEAEVGVPHVYVPWDSAAAAFPAEALGGVSAVVHLAGEPLTAGRWSAAVKARIRASRLLGTQRLVAAMAAAGGGAPPVLVAVSAIGIYPETPAGDPATEASPAGSGFLADLCREWEAAAAVAAQAGSRVVNLRLGLVLGREGGILERLLPLFAAGLGGALGDGRQWFSWIHADDVVALVLRALADQEWHGAFNATAPAPVTNAEFSALLAAAAGRRGGPAVPKAALRAVFGEMAGALLASQRVLPARALGAGFTFRYPQLPAALAAEVTPDSACDQVFAADQWLPKPPAEVFPFFADERNLERLTPASLGFKVLRPHRQALAAGALIDYRLKVHGLPVAWRTRILDWEPPHQFSDEQLRGPYAKWHHTHTFRALPHQGVNGTLMSDRVLYRLPLGGLGRVVAGGLVRRDLRAIFAFRREAALRWI